MEEKQLEVNINVAFPSNRLAQIAYDVLRVDAEPKRSGARKELSVNNNFLQVKFSGELVRQIRVGVNCFFDNIILILQTIDFAGQPVSDTYSHY